MEEDAGRSSESPRLKQAQAELKEAQAELKEAQAELKKAQHALLSAADKDKDIHENIVQSAERNVQSAERMRDARLDAVKQMQGTSVQSSEHILVKKLDELKEQLEQVAKNEALLMEAFLNRFTLTPVSHYSSTTLDGEWHRNAVEYYNTKSCLVLQKLFPEDFRAQPWWLDATGWESTFPAVAEHIIPKNGWHFVQNELGIQIDSARNSLLLLRHLEHTFQDGDWSLIPVGRGGGAVNFKIYVSQELKETTVNYIDRNGGSEPVFVKKAGLKLKPLKFRDLHERDFWIQPPPFLRALFLKARMAWQKHKEDDQPLPDPIEFANAFSESCDKWNHFMVGRLLSSIKQQKTAGETQPP
ncbi:unnamed protein product [Durusdinium trenchii]|uniref:HNH nuclease domain-containing protein n=2 Tax=Durusdinium trenchii TaxID=1381693 RepID=A0ABP0NYW1_9DINO